MTSEENRPSSKSLRLLPKSVIIAMKQIGIEKLADTQEKAIPLIMRGMNVLLIAPTGSGKTEAALLPVLSKLISIENRRGISLLYITPLRALNRDMMKRIVKWCTLLGLSVDVRHGDTPSPIRRKQALKPPDILITTPETLQAILPGRRMQNNLRDVKWIIVDEIHEIAESKRGVQLAVALERLREITGRDFQRIGLSATVGTPEKVGKLLAGSRRPVEIIRVPVPKGYRYWIEWPQPDEEDFDLSTTLYTSPEAAARIRTIKDLCDAYTSTLIFVNSRQVAEMLALRLSLLDPKIGIHHGSLSREERTKIEDSFKKGLIKAIVCTSTLELGIDIGTADLVIQYLSPRQVGPFIQRVGRSGHRLGLTSEGVILTAFVDDALESIAVVSRARSEKVEPTKIHEGALDVLAHQIVGLSLDHGGISLSKAVEIVSRAYPFRRLDKKEFQKVAGFLSKLGLIRFEGDRIMPTKKARKYYFSNLSMIPDERRYPVVDLTANRTIGIVGEEFIMLRARVGLHFICRGMVWNIEQISDDGVYVTPVEDPRAALPGWDGEILPIPYELAKEVGGLRRKIAEKLEKDGVELTVSWLCKEFQVDSNAARKIVGEIWEQLENGAPVPSDNLILIEGFDRYLIVNCCLGELANRTLGYVIDQRLSRKKLIRNWWADAYRILIELPVEVSQSNFRQLVEQVLPRDCEEVEKDFHARISERFPFGYYMKFVAERFGAIERGLSLGEERLLDLYNRFRQTPIFVETMREVLQEKVDVETVKKMVSAIRSGKIRVETRISIEKPTPLSYHILNKYAEIPEMIAPEQVQADALERMRNAIMHTKIELICMECGKRQDPVAIRDLPPKPGCYSCGSTLLAILPGYKGYLVGIVNKRLGGEKLSEEEARLLADLRRTADVIHSYGRRGIIALSVYGIGPQTALRILSKMHYSEDELLKDLLEAKLQYIRTKPYWKT
ncbi:MAG: DEAD/DEAH box helicase [Thermoproteota archaeon]